MEVRFHLPNFMNMYNAQLNYSLVLLLERSPELFYEGVRIGSVFDSPPVAWNGGRIVAGEVSLATIEQNLPQIFKVFNDRGVACRLTFSNPLIKAEHLEDEKCNRILELAENGMNGAIVCSDLLESHIRLRFPGIGLTSSTCKQLRQIDEISQELEKDYDLVVLDYNANRDMELLREIPHKERCELLVNAVCMPECPRRREHYRHIGTYQLEHCASASSSRANNANDWECSNMERDVFERRKSPNYLSPSDIFEKLVPLGYRNFKIEGRGNPFLDLAEQYVYFMAKPEHRDEVRYRLLSDVLTLRGLSS